MYAIRSYYARLDDNWFVYANYLLCDAVTDRSGEIDFLVVHRELGLMAIECKGRGVRFDGRNNFV